jgi:4-amino-4-deoxy-L-arabinose transferase-like glycosyltransferase
VASTAVAPPTSTPDAPDAPEGEAQATERTRRRPPRAVLVATLLFGMVTALWTVAVPAFRAPDEAAHLDLILYLADGNGYPSYDGRYFGEEVNFDTDRYLVNLTQPWPRFDEADATPRGERPDADDLGLEPDAGARRNDARRAGYPYVYNQMPQHPPVYYVAQAAVLRFERWVLPGHGIPSMDRELGLLRLMDVLMVMPLPLLAWATVRRMGGSDRAGTIAALLPLGVPQLMHIGAAITNDALFMLLGGILAVLLAGVGRGVRTRRTDLAVGLVLGVTLLTKAFAVMFVPWVAVAYALAAWTARRWRPLLDGALAGAVAAAVGAWWWVRNWVVEGEPAPTTETLTRTTAQQPDGFEPDALRFLLFFPARLLSRTWAWVGHGTPKFELPGWVVLVLAVLVAAAGVAAFLAARRGRGTDAGASEVAEAPTGVEAVAAGVGPRRVDVLAAWLPALLVALFVARRSVGLYETTGKVAFVQGRYLFGALVPPMAVVGLGVAHKLGKAGPLATLVFVAALQAAVLGEVVAGAWSGPGFFGPVRGALAWSPWPPLAVGLVAAGVVAATAWLVADGVRAIRRP